MSRPYPAVLLSENILILEYKQSDHLVLDSIINKQKCYIYSRFYASSQQFLGKPTVKPPQRENISPQQVTRHLFLSLLQVQRVAPSHRDSRNSSFRTRLFVTAPWTKSELVSTKLMIGCYLFSSSELNIVAFSTFTCGEINLIDESR